MYIPKPFKQVDIQPLLDTMKANPFGTVISIHEGFPFLSHLPLLIETRESDKVVLVGHMARPNPQWKHFCEGTEVTTIFHGPHTYITPSWYSDPKNDVPTWNYTVVHAYGTPKIIDDFDGIESILNKSVDEFERLEPSPWKLQLSEDLKRNLVRGIVGFEIEVTRLEGKFKLSQNRTIEDRLGVMQGLSRRTDEMSKKVLDSMATL